MPGCERTEVDVREVPSDALWYQIFETNVWKI